MLRDLLVLRFNQQAHVDQHISDRRIAWLRVGLSCRSIASSVVFSEKLAKKINVNKRVQTDMCKLYKLANSTNQASISNQNCYEQDDADDGG